MSTSDWTQLTPQQIQDMLASGEFSGAEAAPAASHTYHYASANAAPSVTTSGASLSYSFMSGGAVTLDSDHSRLSQVSIMGKMAVYLYVLKFAATSATASVGKLLLPAGVAVGFVAGEQADDGRAVSVQRLADGLQLTLDGSATAAGCTVALFYFCAKAASA